MMRMQTLAAGGARLALLLAAAERSPLHQRHQAGRAVGRRSEGPAGAAADPLPVMKQFETFEYNPEGCAIRSPCGSGRPRFGQRPAPRPQPAQ